jgi:hypothetical protein
LEWVYKAIGEERGRGGEEVYALDSMMVKVHPDAHGAGKKRSAGHREEPGRTEHEDTRLTAGDRKTAAFRLSGGNAPDTREGRVLIATGGHREHRVGLLMDGAYEDERTRRMAREAGYIPVVPPKRNRVHPWKHDKDLYIKEE